MINICTYQTGIYEFTRLAESAVRDKEIALVTFLDIEGAFECLVDGKSAAKAWSWPSNKNIDQVHVTKQNGAP